MKGLMQTASFLMAVQTPFGGLMDEGGLLNEVTAFYYKEQDRIIITGDCAINIAPNLEEKVKITKNLIHFAKAFGCETVKVAALSVIEKANPEIQSSMDAKALSEMDWGSDVLVEGPFALDNALDEESAKHKGMSGEVAGHADVLVMPDIHAGNVFHKCIHFLGHMPFAAGTLGAQVPIIMNSRTDDEDAKYYSIMSAVLLSLVRKQE
jgi:Phosphotransacetylase